MSFGKNIRGSGAASRALLAGSALCALPNAEIDRRNASVHTNVFIQPPEVCRALNGNLKTHIPNLPRPVELSKFISAEWMGAEHCNLLANSDSDLLGLNPELQETNSKNGSRRALKVPNHHLPEFISTI
jgi:hypothetical protein